MESHFGSQSHKDFMKMESDKKWAVFNPIMREKIIYQWLQIIVKNNVPYKTFKQDEHLMEAAALLIESQSDQPIDRNSLRQLFPDPRQMAMRIPIMKRRIDGTSIILISPFTIYGIFIFTVFLHFCSEHLKSILPLLAEWGELSLVLDHKHIHNKQGDREAKCFGFSAVVPDRFRVQHSVLLDYIPCNSSSADQNIPLLNELLVKFNLVEQFKKGRISMSCDGAMVKTVTDLFRQHVGEGGEGIYTFCQVHNLDNMIKRTVLILLDEYMPDGSALYKDLQTHINDCSKALGDEFNQMEVSAAIKYKVSIFDLKYSIFFVTVFQNSKKQ